MPTDSIQKNLTLIEKGLQEAGKEEYAPEHIDAFRKVFDAELLALWGYTLPN